MALVLNDRVKTTSTATGNSQTTFAISATAATGFDTFAAGIGTSSQLIIPFLIKERLNGKLV